MVLPFDQGTYGSPATVAQKHIDVHLDHCIVDGLLETGHPRVSDHLATDDGVVRLIDAQVRLRDGRVLSEQSTVLINRTEILYIVDHSPRTGGSTGLLIERAPRDVFLNLGSIWVRGKAHLPIGGELATYFSGALNRFMAITHAVVDGTLDEPRTFLINRDQLRCLVVQPEEDRQG